MDELLGEVRIDYDRQQTLDASLHQLKEVLDSLKPEAEKQVRPSPPPSLTPL